MVLIDIRGEEVKAIDELYKKVEGKCSIQLGLVLGLFRIKIQEAINKEAKRLQKKKAEEIVAAGKKKDGKQT